MRIYFSGIGGTGLAPLANLALDAGYAVLGSDLHESDGTAELRQRGVNMSIGEQDGNFLRQQNEIEKIDLLVYTSALPADHAELLVAKALGIQTVKRDQLINLIIEDKGLKLVAVAGTHGKTTTVAMIIWACKELGKPISYLAGTNLAWGASGHFDSKSQYLVYEADEYDRNFLHFRPWCAVITVEDYDHPDIYPTIKDYREAFQQFRQQSEQVIENVKIVEGVTLVGKLRKMDASLATKAVSLMMGATEAEIIEAINRFPGAGRRFEKITERVYSDYGHHPKEIKATIQMARELCDREAWRGVVVLYQPHQNSRQHEIKADYHDAFLGADKIFWVPTYLVRENPKLKILSPADLVVGLDNAEVAEAVELNDELAQKLKSLHNDGWMILLMTAGPADAWFRKVFQA